MAMQKVQDLAVKTGTRMKDGKEVGNYENVGAVLQGDDGQKMILLKRTFNPAGVPNPDNKDSIILSRFDVQQSGQSQAPQKQAAPQQQAPQQAPQQQNPPAGFEDELIPF